MVADDPSLVHILREQEIVSKVTSEKITETGTILRIKMKREVSIKIINPQGVVKNLCYLKYEFKRQGGFGFYSLCH